MRLLEINSVVNFGSTGRIVSSLAKYLQYEGDEVLVCYGRGNSTASFPLYHIGHGNFNFYEAVLETRLFDNSGFASREPTKKLIKIIDKFQPDIVHLHNLHGYYVNVEELFDYLSESNLKVVWTFHDIWPFSPHAAIMALNDFNVPSTIKHKSELSLYPKTWFINKKDHNYWRKRYVFTQLSPSNLYIVAPSKWMKNLIKNSFFKNYPIHVIYNGIDIVKFQNYLSLPLYVKHSGPKRVLGVASVWNENKGLSYLNQLSEVMGNNLNITLIGDTRHNYVNKLIHKVGIISDIAQLTNYYQSSDVFVNPTLAETFGLTNVESLVCGTPVITFNSGGNSEMLNSNTGIVVQRGDFNGLLEAVKNIKKNEKISELCQSQGFLFSEKRMDINYYNLYKKILSKSL